MLEGDAGTGSSALGCDRVVAGGAQQSERCLVGSAVGVELWIGVGVASVG